MLSFSHQPARELLSDLGEERRPALLHLLACPECRRIAEEELLPPPPLWREGERPAGPGRGRPPGSGAERLIAAAFAGFRAAQERVDELLALPAAARQRAAGREGRFADPMVAQLLREGAERALGEPARAEELALLALAAARQLPAHPPGRAEEARVRAWCLVGEARRRRGDRGGAEAALRQAAVPDAPPWGEERGQFCAVLGLLRWDEGRLDEAAALLARASEVFGDADERHNQALCRVALGLLLLGARDPERALAPLALSLDRADVALPPALAVRAALGRAYCEAAMGRGERADELLAAARGRQWPGAPEGERLEWLWWEARIAAWRGRLETAGEDLDAVRRRLLAAGSLREAALASLELAVLRVRGGRPEAVAELGHELAHAFGGEVTDGQALRLGGGLALLAGMAAGDDFEPAADLLWGEIVKLRAGRAGRPDLARRASELVEVLEGPATPADVENPRGGPAGEPVARRPGGGKATGEWRGGRGRQ